jgi:hypothetical protein
MKESLTIQPHHLERGAYLYIRQSSLRQVLENVESTKRQYALRSRALALGWRDEQIRLLEKITSTILRTREETVIPLAMEGLGFQLQGGQFAIRHFLARLIGLLIQHRAHG